LYIIVYVTYKYKNLPQIYYGIIYISLLGKPSPSPAGAWLPWETMATTWVAREGDLNWAIKKMMYGVVMADLMIKHNT
jgi:hypothetical protein